MSNMRSLHVSLSSYLNDKGHWPQEPDELWDQQDDGPLEDWWIETLTPYGGIAEVWMCPTIKRLVTSKSEKKRPRMHYGPTRFDKRPFTPLRWSTQPWLIEIGNMHGRGAHIIFTDGSIRVMSDFEPKEN